MRVAVVDIGTNSTRLLVADIAPDGTLTELERRSTVTRLGQGVDATGQLAPEAMQRVFAVLGSYRESMDRHGVGPNVAVLTSAVRDAANGPEFTGHVREDYALDARTITGEEEARLTFQGATDDRVPGAPAPVVVIDIGGGSTEFVAGRSGEVDFHVSTQAGVVRHTERHLTTDPPAPAELAALAADARRIFADAVPAAVRRSVRAAIGVAGTPTSCAAIEQRLEPYDPARVHGFRLTRAICAAQLDHLVRLTEAERREVPGLHPDRAPTVVAGIVLLLEAMDLLGLDAVEVSEHDLLRAAAHGLAAP